MVFSRLEAVYNFAHRSPVQGSERNLDYFWLLRFQVRGILKNKMEKVWNYLKTVFTCCGRDQEGAM